jgi:protein-tyrosine phosphatase
VRADSVRNLTDEGWEALVEYGIRTIVDLRLHSERAEDPPRDVPVDVVHISLVEELTADESYAIAEQWISAPDTVSATRDAYLEILERYRANVALAVTAIAQAPPGGVLVHCFGGKDRTGLVAALLLRLAGVGLDDIAAEYALSAENLSQMLDAWIESTDDKRERAFRRRVGAAPAEAMSEVIVEIEGRYGSVEEYLRAGGVTEDDLERARDRLRS